jgi:hypothetical protein
MNTLEAKLAELVAKWRETGKKYAHTDCTQASITNGLRLQWCADELERLSIDVPAMARRLSVELDAATMAEHKSHVDFENELYATLVDPLADGPIKEAEMRKQLLESARWYRQHVYDLEMQVNAAHARNADGDSKSSRAPSPDLPQSAPPLATAPEHGAYEYKHKPKCPKGPNCKCGLTNLLAKLNKNYIHSEIDEEATRNDHSTR